MRFLTRYDVVVGELDISFARPTQFEDDIKQAKHMIYGYLNKYPDTLERPLFINGVIAQGVHRQTIASWPPPRVHAIKASQLHGTSQQATRFQPERWSFNEWAAAARNRSRNYRT